MKICGLDIHIKRGNRHIIVPPESIKFINMSNFTETIQSVSADSIEHANYCELFVLELSGNENEKMPAIIKELDEKKDILDIRINFSSEKRLMTSIFFHLGWDINSIVSDSEENEFQKSIISTPGNYYLVINPSSALDDYFDLEQIEHEEWVNNAYKKISLGEKI